MTNGKRERIRTKPVTPLARAKAADKVKRLRKRAAAVEKRMADAVPAFLKIEADECEKPLDLLVAQAQAQGFYDQPRDYGPKSGILITRPIHGRTERVERDQTRTGFLLCILSGVVLGCIVAAVVS